MISIVPKVAQRLLLLCRYKKKNYFFGKCYMMDVLSYFSNNAIEFSEEYKAKAEFKERVFVWSGLLDKYAEPPMTAFDMGCGSGIFSFYLAEKGLNVVGFDATSEMIELCERQKEAHAISNVRFIETLLPFAHYADIGLADLIICSSVLEYIDELEQTLKQINELLTPQGIFIFSLPNAESIYRNLEKIMFKLTDKPRYLKYVKHILTLDYTKLLLEKIGFTLIDTQYYARVSSLSRLLGVFLPPKYIDSLFVAVFQKKL